MSTTFKNIIAISKNESLFSGVQNCQHSIEKRNSHCNKHVSNSLHMCPGQTGGLGLYISVLLQWNAGLKFTEYCATGVLSLGVGEVISVCSGDGFQGHYRSGKVFIVTAIRVWDIRFLPCLGKVCLVCLPK